MKLLKLLSLASFLLGLAMPACAAVTVTSPYNGSTLTSPFTLTANASGCSSQTVVSMGYSIDTGSTTSVSGNYIQKSVSAAKGGHTLHVKAWGKSGAVCVTDVSVNVSGTSSGNPSVSSPGNGSIVNSPFTLAASSSTCGGQSVTSIGYSVDGGATTTVKNTVLKASVTTTTGGHTLHVKSWGSGGAKCDNDVAIKVNATANSVPSGATSVSNLQLLTPWSAMHDAGTPGTSSGSMKIVSSPSRSGSARHHATSYTKYGGERYAVSFGDDTSAKNFLYDTWVYIQNTTAGIANIEMDLNQVMSNGWTVIYGFQCDGWNNTWDYATNQGTPGSPKAKWLHTAAKCSPKKWAVNTWHHVQIAYARDDYGYVTYKTVTLDGVVQNINVKVLSAFALGWGKTMVTNFQIDGDTSTSGSSSVFLDELTVSRW